MQTWFGRPPLTAAKLAEACSCSVSALRRHLCTADREKASLEADTLLYPCSRVWPMGFSWSSAVAQDVSLGLLRGASFSEEQVICVEEPTPVDQSEIVFVLTDDCIFGHAVRSSEHLSELHRRAERRVRDFDRSMEQCGVQRKPEKDATAEDILIGMGCLLKGNPPSKGPAPTKLFTCLVAILGLVQHGTASPVAFASLLGAAQWFCLTDRSCFSVFRQAYAFAQLQPDTTLQRTPKAVLDELTLFLSLSPLLDISLARDYVPLILASDAAPEFGFGLSAAAADQSLLRELGRLSEKRGDYVRFSRDNDPDAELEKPRLGEPHRLALRRCDFRDLLSIKAKRRELSGVMEMHGLLLALKWLARNPHHHGHRALILLDAKAVLFAAQKGRSSSPQLGRLLQRIGAYRLAADIALRLLYVPTEDMPADAPSRGIRRRPAHRRQTKKRGYTKSERRLH